MKIGFNMNKNRKRRRKVSSYLEKVRMAKKVKRKRGKGK